MLAKKFQGDSHELVGFFDLRRMSASINYFKFGSIYGLVIQLGTFQWNYSVLFAPNNTGGDRHTLEQMGESRVMHVWSPANTDRHFPVSFRHVGLFCSWRFFEDLMVLRDLLRIMKCQLRNLGRADNEDVGDFAVLRLDANCVDQHQTTESVPAGSCNFSGQPAAHGKSDCPYPLKIMYFLEPSVKGSKVLYSFYPFCTV